MSSLAAWPVVDGVTSDVNVLEPWSLSWLPNLCLHGTTVPSGHVTVGVELACA